MLSVVVGLLLLWSHCGCCLRCYTCSVSQSDNDLTCVDAPDLVEQGSPITNCSKKYCTTFRQEYRHPKGTISSMNRGCTDKPIFVNQNLEDETYLTYYRACREDLCNKGSGKEAISGGIILDIGPEITLLVEGVGSAGTALTFNTFLRLLLLMILNILILN